jgi:hypothetical protein
MHVCVGTCVYARVCVCTCVLKHVCAFVCAFVSAYLDTQPVVRLIFPPSVRRATWEFMRGKKGKKNNKKKGGGPTMKKLRQARSETERGQLFGERNKFAESATAYLNAAELFKQANDLNAHASCLAQAGGLVFLFVWFTLLSRHSAISRCLGDLTRRWTLSPSRHAVALVMRLSLAGLCPMGQVLSMNARSLVFLLCS